MPRDKKTGVVTPPKDQSFKGGFSIRMMTYNFLSPTGEKDVRFEHADELAAWYNQNRKRKPRKKKKAKGSSENRGEAVGSKTSGKSHKRNNRRKGKRKGLNPS